MTAQVIAIDGPAYVGKSVIAKALAGMMGYLYINTGHMYRALAKIALQTNLDLKNSEAVITLAKKLTVEFKNMDQGCRTIVEGRDYTDSLDSYELVLLASQMAAMSGVREIFTQAQREYASKHTIVMEGRDIGSVVFPNAAWKFFVTASLDIRAQRMLKMMKPEERVLNPSLDSLIEKLKDLDEHDRNRKASPLIMPEDAIVYDNSDSPSGTQDAWILKYYISHPLEITKNANLLETKKQELSVPLWKQ